MRVEILAMIIQQGGALASALVQNWPKKHSKPTEEVNLMVSEKPQEVVDEITAGEGKASSIEAGCVPCAIGHFGTCSGLLNEGMRFAKKDGVASSEVINRVNMCLDELNTMERVDLRPELILNLSDWEKELANKALVASRATRHSLESLTSVGDLEKVAAVTQNTRNEVGREWFKQKLDKMPKEQKVQLAEKAIEKMEEE